MSEPPTPVSTHPNPVANLKFLFDYQSRSSDHVPPAPLADLPDSLRRTGLPLPDINEVDVIRHFMALSRKNYGVDNGFYPLGSCTMKYNPKINEDVARLDGFANLHPLSPESASQGSMRLMHELEQYLCEITGMDAFSLQPAAGAHGELTSLMIAKAYFKGKRKTVVLPDSAHGTNPASAAMCGFQVIQVKTDARGNVDLEQLKAAMNDDVAVFMMTNPSTLGLFDEHVQAVARIVHDAGALMYCDGANMNAMMGITRPGDQGFDMMHLNLHKTFSTPHGGGGPGAGPIGVKKALEPYLPVPRIVKKKQEKQGKGDQGEVYSYETNLPKSIGRVRAFYGNFGMLVRAYTYIRAHGTAGLREVSEVAVLNANYIMRALQDVYALPYDRPCAHECVFSGEPFAQKGVHTLDIAKRLLDYGFHAPTIYFPLIVPEAIMIEPTETESKATLDAFIKTMRIIAQEIETSPSLLHAAPVNTPVGRLDGVNAARHPNLRWTPACSIC